MPELGYSERVLSEYKVLFWMVFPAGSNGSQNHTAVKISEKLSNIPKLTQLVSIVGLVSK